MNLLPKIQEKIKNHIGPKIKNNNEKLFKIIKEQQELKNELNFIEQKLNAIEKVEEQAKAFRQELMEAKANSKASSSAADGTHDKSTHPDPSNEMQVFCPVCGTTLSSSNFSKHVEMCYRKIERNLSYESLQKSEIPSSHRLYCDEYDVKDKERKYCKRLWVSCPEHTRKPKAVADEICCCPLDDSFTVVSGQGSSSNEKLEGTPNNFIFHSVDFDPVTYTAKKRKIEEDQDENPTSFAPKLARRDLSNEENLAYNYDLPSSPYPDDRGHEENDQNTQSQLRNYGKLKFCRLTKKQCSKHFNWETTFKAALHIQRARIYTKLEELGRSEARCNLANYTKYDMFNILRHEVVKPKIEDQQSSSKVEVKIEGK